jgi:hypothetical protein
MTQTVKPTILDSLKDTFKNAAGLASPASESTPDLSLSAPTPQVKNFTPPPSLPDPNVRFEIKYDPDEARNRQAQMNQVLHCGKWETRWAQPRSVPRYHGGNASQGNWTVVHPSYLLKEYPRDGHFEDNEFYIPGYSWSDENSGCIRIDQNPNGMILMCIPAWVLEKRLEIKRSTAEAQQYAEMIGSPDRALGRHLLNDRTAMRMYEDNTYSRVDNEPMAVDTRS